MIRQGKNAVGVTLANGWYRGYIAFEGHKNVFGKDISLLLQLVIRYKDGHTDTVATGPGWKSSTGEVLMAEIYNGETIDHRKEKTGWALPGYDDAAWNAVQTETFPMNNLTATINEPVKKHETFHAVKLLTTPDGDRVIDFGQNLVWMGHC